MYKASNIRNINLLFLIVLVLQLSNLFLLWMPQYVRLILNQALFVFLPAYLYLRISRQPVRPRVRWNWPGLKLALLSVLVGAGLYPISGALAGILQSLLGYINFAAPADAIPTSIPMALLVFIAYAGMAPLCEEYLFRGVIQPEYEQRRGPIWAVLFVGFLFIIFHLSLLQGLSIILLSLALGYVNHRTRSLPASILTHMGANFLAALVITQTVFNLDINPFIFSIPVILGGLVLAGAALIILARSGPPLGDGSGVILSSPDSASPARFPITSTWPLVLAGIIYLVTVGAEVYYSRIPAQTDPLTVQPVQWGEPRAWQYELRNVEDTLVGEGECHLVPNSVELEIICSSFVSAYEVTIGRSTWMSVGGSRVDQLRWHSSDGRLLSGQSELDLLDGDFHLESSWTPQADGMHIRQRGSLETGSPVTFPYDKTLFVEDRTLLIVPDYTWPWQLGGIQLEAGEMGEVIRFNPFTWRDATQDSGPVWESRLVTVIGLEEVVTPAGSFSAWKVQFGDNQTAWYSLNDGFSVVKFFNGAETWSLK
jgi:membrane protease YdiL (CAAX protease family)